MKAWMIYRKEDATKNQHYIQFHVDEGKERGIEFEILYTEQLSYGIHNGKPMLWYQGNELEQPEFVIMRTIDPLLSLQLEAMELPVFNNAKVAAICNDKARTYQYVSQLGIPMIETRFCKNHQLEACINSCEPGGSYVFKAVAGHGGSQVFLYEKGQPNEILQYQEIKKGLKGSDFVMQPLTGSKHQDLRVYVIGKRIISAVLRTANSGFKSNFSLGGDVCEYQLSKEQVDLVNRIIGMFDFGLVGIDFLIGDDGGLIFNEIEDVVGARMLYKVSNVNLVGGYLDFICEKILKKERID